MMIGVGLAVSGIISTAGSKYCDVQSVLGLESLAFWSIIGRQKSADKSANSAVVTVTLLSPLW